MSTAHRKPPPLDPATATVAVVLPVRNEAGHLDQALASVLDQTFPRQRIEVIVVDGMSSDNTVSLADGLLSAQADQAIEPASENHPARRGRVVSNPKRTIPSAMNVGIKATQADVIVRVDGHCRLDPDYVETCVRLLSETGAANVGGPMRPRGRGRIGAAMALALCSRFGIGDSRFHFSEHQEFVETVYLGAFRRPVLEEVDGYDEGILANEDFELNHRILQAGYRVLLSPNIRSTYEPRDRLVEIAGQFYRYGCWKARVMRKHPDSIRLRHLAGPALAASLAVSLPAFVVSRKRAWLLPLLVYGAATATASMLTASPRRLATTLMAVFPAMHLSWGLGVWVGLVRSLYDRR